MKAALAITQFNRLDDDGDGKLQVQDLVRAFAKVKGRWHRDRGLPHNQSSRAHCTR